MPRKNENARKVHRGLSSVDRKSELAYLRPEQFRTGHALKAEKRKRV